MSNLTRKRLAGQPANQFTAGRQPAGQTKDKRRAKGLTRADTIALWHAVTGFSKHIDHILRLEGVEEHMLQEERQQLATARAALRKVNSMRKSDNRERRTAKDRETVIADAPKRKGAAT